jgi:hypothetical protein
MLSKSRKTLESNNDVAKLGRHKAQPVKLPDSGDINISQMILNWDFGNNYIAFAPSVTAPGGSYDPDYLLYTSRNYSSSGVSGSYTYFDPKAGFEVDFKVTVTLYSAP